MNGWDRGLVVVGIGDGARQPRAALHFAAQEANRRRTGVLLVHACTPSWSLASLEPVLPLEQREKQGLLALRTAKKRLVPLVAPGIQVRSHVFPGTAIDGLVELSHSASLVVVQRRQISALQHLSTGSTSSNVAARAACPVAVVRQDHQLAGRSGVVVGLDDAAHAGQVLPAAFAEAQLRKSTLTVIHVWPGDTALTAYGWDPLMPERLDVLRHRARAALAETVARYARQFPTVVVRLRVLTGATVPALLRASQSARLLVIGRHGRSHIGSLALGGVARTCLSAATCPVLVTPPSRLSKPGDGAGDDAAGTAFAPPGSHRSRGSNQETSGQAFSSRPRG